MKVETNKCLFLNVCDYKQEYIIEQQSTLCTLTIVKVIFRLQTMFKSLIS